MPRSYRRLAGLLAFLALTLSFTEAVWASTCAMPLSSVEMAMEGSSEDAPRAMHCDGHGDDSGDPHDDASCPFDSAGAAQTCAGVASIPSTSATLAAGSTSGASAVFPVETRIRLLFEASLFRPPRA